jgi:acyl-CoA synthetase (AMP-forming)/AMP-acid ligase II
MPRWTNAPTGWRELPAQAVGPGDRMAYLDHTSREVVELLFAVGKIGVVIVPMNWRLGAPELLAVLTDYARRC